MPQSERWNALGREILFSARTELYMSCLLYTSDAADD